MYLHCLPSHETQPRGDIQAHPSRFYHVRGQRLIIYRYHCTRDQWIVLCPSQGACSSVVECQVKCIENKLGAECADQKRDVAVPSAKKKEHKECSNDHTGVLICRFGFCSTDLYCKRGESCHDDCACCKKNGLASRQEHEVSLLSEDLTALLSPVLAVSEAASKTFGDCVRYQAGFQSCRENDSTPVICDTTDFKWRSAEKCPRGDHCCVRRSNNRVKVYCKC
jgi:hypothetical protein